MYPERVAGTPLPCSWAAILAGRYGNKTIKCLVYRPLPFLMAFFCAPNNFTVE